MSLNKRLLYPVGLTFYFFFRLCFQMNPFEVLQVIPDTSLDEVREAYHRLAKLWHPDKFDASEKQTAELKFKEIAEAYATIKNGTDQNVFTSESPTSSLQVSDDSNISPLKKTPANWLSEAKMAMANKQYDTAISMSQYCFNYPQIAEESRLLYATIVEASGGDVKTQTRAYEEVVRINPSNKKAVLELVDLYLAINMPARAAGMRAKAKTLGAVIESGQASSTEESAGILGKIAGFFGMKRG
ncbi:MAG: DnaJ domain-containing protein [Holophagales bacterium]|nr:DnaJ domain-containing protein [Holophagales bacterium]